MWKREDVVLLIGHVDHEGIRSTLNQSGRLYVKKSLDSKPTNWQTIVDLFDTHSIATVLIKLTEHSYSLIADQNYSAIAASLFARIAATPHAIYIYEGVYTGDYDDEREDHEVIAEWFAAECAGRRCEVRESVNEFLESHSLNIVTYKRNSEVTVLAQAFLAQWETGLLLRLYVPHGQLWASETDRFLQLFRDYLTRVASASVRLLIPAVILGSSSARGKCV